MKGSGRVQLLLAPRYCWNVHEVIGMTAYRRLTAIQWPSEVTSGVHRKLLPSPRERRPWRCFASSNIPLFSELSEKGKKQSPTRFQPVPGVEDTTIGEYMQSDDFLKCSVYLREALGIPASLAERIAIKLAFLGFSADGQVYVRQYPAPLLVEESIKLMVESLTKIPGIDLRRVAQNSPFIFIQSPEARYRMQDNYDWLKTSFHLQENEMGKILNANAYILTQPRERNSEPTVIFLKSLNLDETQLRTVVLRYPRILSLRVKRLKQTLEKLDELGFDKTQVETIVSRFPAVFSLSEEKIDGVISWLSSTVGLNAQDTRTVVHRFPNLLSYSISDNLQRSLDYLKNEMKLDDKSVQNSILYAPDILARRSELLSTHAASAREAGIESSDFASIVKAYPGILRLNLMSSLHRAKLRFLEEELGRDVSPALATNPMYVTYSLARIITRAAYLKTTHSTLHSKYQSAEEQTKQ